MKARLDDLMARQAAPAAAIVRPTLAHTREGCGSAGVHGGAETSGAQSGDRSKKTSWRSRKLTSEV